MNELKIVSSHDGILEVNLNSKMVRLNPIAKSCNKLVGDWLRLQNTQDLICEFQIKNITMGNPIVVNNGGNNVGTWVTKELAIAFMMWCSPSFAVGCLKKLDELFTTGETKIDHQAPATFKEALLLAIEQQEKIENLENQTKTFEIELDQSQEWLTIKKVASLNGLNWQNLDWRILKNISEEFNCLPKKIFDANFPAGVNAYHVLVWKNAYPNLIFDNNVLIQEKTEAIEIKEDIHLNIKDVCKKLNVSKSFIYKKMQSGEIKFNKLSPRKTFFKLSDINDFLNKKNEY